MHLLVIFGVTVEHVYLILTLISIFIGLGASVHDILLRTIDIDRRMTYLIFFPRVYNVQG